MLEIDIKQGESVDKALKRLKTQLEIESVLEECRRRRTFENPTQEKRRKARNAPKKKLRFKYVIEMSNKIAKDKKEKSE